MRVRSFIHSLQNSTFQNTWIKICKSHYEVISMFNWQEKKKEFGCGWARRDDFHAGGTALLGLHGFVTAEQGMKQGKQFFFLTSVNKESGYESEKIVLLVKIR